MRYSSTLLIAFLTVHFGSYLSAYTWNITNYTQAEGTLEVCTTPGIHSCQIQKLPKEGETATFVFDKWYNKGLCLDQIKINGKKVNINPNQEVAKGAYYGRYVGPLGMGVGALVGAIRAKCSSQSILLGTDKNGNYIATVEAEL